MTCEIPKRLIQTGKTAQQPLRVRAMMANVRLLNPDYEYLFFDDESVERFIRQEFSQYWEVFVGFPVAIQRIDLFRYLAVYRYGGFYLDTDVLLADGLSRLLQMGCVFPFEGLTFSRLLRDVYHMDWEIGNYAFGAVPGHPFLGKVIENCIRAQRDPEWIRPMMRGLPLLSKHDFLVLNTTGPGLVTRTLAENEELARQVTVLFPEDVRDVGNWNRFGEFGVHMMDGAWRDRGGFIRSRLTQRMENWKLKRLMKESHVSEATRHHVGAVRHSVSESVHSSHVCAPFLPQVPCQRKIYS